MHGSAEFGSGKHQALHRIWQFVDGLIECSAKFEMSKMRRKVVNRFIETQAEGEMSSGRGKMVYKLIKIVTKG